MANSQGGGVQSGGTAVPLPGDFDGKLNLAIVAFQRWHQDLVDTWVPLARRLRDAYPAFRYYELPTIWRMNPLFRWSIDAGMRCRHRRPQRPRGDHHACTWTRSLSGRRWRSRTRRRSICSWWTVRGVVAWRGAGGFTGRSGRSAGPAVQAQSGR